MGALRFALSHPDRCSGVVMLSGVSRQIWAARMVQNVPLTAASDLAGWSLERYPRVGTWLHPFFWGQLAMGRRLREEFVDMLRTTSPAGPRVAGRALDLHNVSRFPRAPTGSAGVPALVIHARADRAVPFSHALMSLRWLPRAELIALSDGGHLLPLTRPDLAGPINRFLGRLGR
jgi:pimeloyl-ACP methyl ester carboxylesterase